MAGSNTSASELGSIGTGPCSSLPSSPPPSPTKAGRRPVPLRLQGIGVDPSVLVGKALTKITRSQKHPCMCLHFADETYQILVDGYDPVHRYGARIRSIMLIGEVSEIPASGLPKTLEMDPVLESLLDAADGQLDLDRKIDQCALVTLTDKAFQSRQKEQRWDQNHIGVAFKFSEDQVWHCVWATLADYEHGACVFRNYDDVYLNKLQRSPRKHRTRAPSSPMKRH